MMAGDDIRSRLTAGLSCCSIDCDGALTTSSGVAWSTDRIEEKTFHIRDGLGIRLWRQRAGGTTGIVTGRSSHVVQLRADELGMAIVRQGVDDSIQLGLKTRRLVWTSNTSCTYFVHGSHTNFTALR